ncbi:hypothetical protein Bca101_020861 [Brassica carinata]
MSSRSSKRNSSSHSSSDDSPAHVTVKQEESVEEEKRNAYYRALVGSPPTLPEIPVPKRPLRQPGAPFAPSGGYYSMLPKKDMAVIQGTTSNPKSWQERFFFVQIDGESVEESCLHLFPRAWNFNRGNNPTAHLPGNVLVREIFFVKGRFLKSFTLERIRDAVKLYRSRVLFRRHDAEPVTVAPTRTPQAEVSPGFVPTEKDGASGFPPNNFFDGLPPEFTTDESLEDEEKQRFFAEGSQRVNEVWPFELL